MIDLIFNILACVVLSGIFIIAVLCMITVMDHMLREFFKRNRF